MSTFPFLIQRFDFYNCRLLHINMHTQIMLHAGKDTINQDFTRHLAIYSISNGKFGIKDVIESYSACEKITKNDSGTIPESFPNR